MDEKLAKLKKEVLGHFKKEQIVFLATGEGDKPRVRPVTLIYFNDRFWVTTGANTAKIKQIKGNANIEFCLMFKKDKSNGYIRGAGIAKIIQDIKIKKLLADNIPFFKDYWETPDDPNFALVELVIKEIEYLQPEEFLSKRFSL